MKIKDTDAAQNALLAMYAMDMYNMYPNELNPPPDSRISEDGWRLIGYLRFSDVVAPQDSGPLQLYDKEVYYGYAAESIAHPLRHVVAIWGTKGIEEWLEDAEFHQVQYNDTHARVEQGFYNRPAMPGFER